MGCSIFSNRSKPALKKLSSRNISITPANFVRLSKSYNYEDYVEIQKLGSGAFAEVMLCFHKITKTHRAVKLIHKSALSASQKDTKYWLKEIHILRNLDHPNILKCFEIFEDSRLYYVATEYCPAGDLFSEIVKMKKFKESQVADLMFQLLSALVYCHSKRVIHRDLKPENILLMEKGESLSIKVADFGSSVVLDPDARLSGCYGSAYYLAPEVFGKSYNEKCDIWSVGIIMYILLTGKPPYTGRDSEQILKQAEKTPFVLTPTKLFGISEDAADLLKQLLKHNPAQRISAKAALQHKWLQSHRDKLGADTDLALKNLQNFNCQSKLKEAVYVFVASQITSHEDLKYFRDCFLKLDKDGDGKLTKEELIQEYSKSMTREKAEEISNSVIEKLDQDNDGMIDYTEFLVSCQERLKNISLDNLEIAFRMFDADGNGEISAEEIKEILNDGAIDDEDIWKIILKEADTNGDGLVDLKEFINMMTAMKTMKSAKSGNSAGVKSYVSTQQVLK